MNPDDNEVTYPIWAWEYRQSGGHTVWMEASKYHALKESKQQYATGRVRSRTVTVTKKFSDWEFEG